MIKYIVKCEYYYTISPYTTLSFYYFAIYYIFDDFFFLNYLLANPNDEIAPVLPREIFCLDSDTLIMQHVSDRVSIQFFGNNIQHLVVDCPCALLIVKMNTILIGNFNLLHLYLRNNQQTVSITRF